MKKTLLYSLLLFVINFCYAQPPNDDCSNAIMLDVNADESCDLTYFYSYDYATPSPEPNNCPGNAEEDIWFEFTALSTQHTVTIIGQMGSYANAVFTLYSGTCGNLVEMACTSSNDRHLNDLVIGETYKLRVFGGTGIGADICISTMQVIDVNSLMYNNEQLVSSVLINNPCTVVTNITTFPTTEWDWMPTMGYFEKGPATFPFENGIVLTTGNAANAPGPKGVSFGGDGQSAGGWPGDDELTELAGVASTKDASIIEFDFVPAGDQISFQYIYASEEYGYYQCQYSDVLAFILTNLETGEKMNIAVVPGTTDFVSSMTIRDNAYNDDCESQNEQYFGTMYEIGDLLAPVNYRGITVPLTAEATVIPGTAYHLKLAIADRVDVIHDSAVFIDAASFNLGLPSAPTLSLASSSGNVVCPGYPTILTADINPDAYDFTWMHNDEVLVDESNASLTVTEPGSYTLQAQHPEEDCSITFTATLNAGMDASIVDYTILPQIIEGEEDGIATFNIGAVGSTMFSDLGITLEEYDYSFHLTAEDAATGAGISPTLFTNTTNPQTLYFRIIHIENGCYLVKPVSLMVMNSPVSGNIGTPSDMVVCDDNNDGMATFNFSSNNDIVLGSLDPAYYTLTYHETAEDANSGENNINPSEPYVSGSTTIYVRVYELASPENYDVAMFSLIVEASPVPGSVGTLTVYDGDGTDDLSTSVDLTAVVPDIIGPASGLDVSFYTTIESAENDSSPISSPEAYFTGSATVYFRIENLVTSCFATGSFEIEITQTVPAPSGPQMQDYVEGETLADLEVDGQNIQWYDNPGNPGPPNGMDGDEPLDINTPLVDATTYYASQTINGFESTERLGVTVSLVLGSNDFRFSGFSYWPNPVSDILEIRYGGVIETVAIFNLLGQQVATQQVNTNTAAIDFSSLDTGIYVVEAHFGNSTATFKVVKK